MQETIVWWKFSKKCRCRKWATKPISIPNRVPIPILKQLVGNCWVRNLSAAVHNRTRKTKYSSANQSLASQRQKRPRRVLKHTGSPVSNSDSSGQAMFYLTLWTAICPLQQINPLSTKTKYLHIDSKILEHYLLHTSCKGLPQIFLGGGLFSNNQHIKASLMNRKRRLFGHPHWKFRSFCYLLLPN